MRIRPYRPEDRETLKEMYDRFGYKCDFPEDLSRFQVVETDTGKILMAAGWKLVPEIQLVMEPGRDIHPLVKLKGLAMIYETLRSIITAAGYREAIAEVAPELGGFRRHLQRHFGFGKGWTLFRVEER